MRQRCPWIEGVELATYYLAHGIRGTVADMSRRLGRTTGRPLIEGAGTGVEHKCRISCDADRGVQMAGSRLQVLTGLIEFFEPKPFTLSSPAPEATGPAK